MQTDHRKAERPFFYDYNFGARKNVSLKLMWEVRIRLRLFRFRIPKVVHYTNSVEIQWHLGRLKDVHQVSSLNYLKMYFQVR